MRRRISRSAYQEEPVGAVVAETARFALYVHCFSAETLALCPDLPPWVLRLYDRRVRQSFSFPGSNRDLDSGMAALAWHTEHGRPDLDRKLDLHQSPNPRVRGCG